MDIRTPITIGLMVLLVILDSSWAKAVWEQPGCHKVGHTRTITEPGCMPFEITTNACRGYCTSFSIPSPPDVVEINPNQEVTSYGNCCNIIESAEVTAKVLCLDGIQNFVFKSALKCDCSHCKKR